MTATARRQETPEPDVATRIAALDAQRLAASLDASGYAVAAVAARAGGMRDACRAL